MGLFLPHLVDTYQLECDGRTDGRIYYTNIALCMHSMLTHDKNQTISLFCIQQPEKT